MYGGLKRYWKRKRLRAAQWLRLPSQDPGGAGPDGLRFTPEAAVLANQDHAEAPVQPEEIPDWASGRVRELHAEDRQHARDERRVWRCRGPVLWRVRAGPTQWSMMRR
ncbi:hypothetical protein Acr_23g0021510 [Actinidia rufa]|uniref:Uncharacterized protein n=1 Tax=Actinidia rufa TaxID=165716 RepID=A0A7J0GSJ5_9ERIC|nr:hypothetical protein Acr_23g0021510 [Actinidia rufa]